MTIGILKTLCIVMNCKLDDLIEFKYELYHMMYEHKEVGR